MLLILEGEMNVVVTAAENKSEGCEELESLTENVIKDLN